MHWSDHYTIRQFILVLGDLLDYDLALSSPKEVG